MNKWKELFGVDVSGLISNSSLYLQTSIMQQLIPACALVSSQCVRQEFVLRLVGTGGLAPVFTKYWSSPLVLTLQLHHSRPWDIVGETQKFSLILDLYEVRELN